MTYHELASSDWRWLKLIKHAGFTMHLEDELPAGERGMHVHVNRGYFDNDEQIMEMTADYMGSIILHKMKSFSMVSRFAKESSYCQHNVLPLVLDERANVMVSDGRYCAVLWHTETIEFRAFNPLYLFNDYRDILDNVHWVACASELAKKQ
jgi:hypothetical protein